MTKGLLKKDFGVETLKQMQVGEVLLVFCETIAQLQPTSQTCFNMKGRGIREDVKFQVQKHTEVTGHPFLEIQAVKY